MIKAITRFLKRLIQHVCVHDWHDDSFYAGIRRFSVGKKRCQYELTLDRRCTNGDGFRFETFYLHRRVCVKCGKVESEIDAAIEYIEKEWAHDEYLVRKEARGVELLKQADQI